jgi:ATP-dependent Clp protease, protease subunit
MEREVGMTRDEELGITPAGALTGDGCDGALRAGPPAARPAAPGEEDDDEGVRPPRPTASSLSEGVRERLFKARTLIISGEVTQRLAAEVMGQLLAMSADSDEPITIFINSQGGHVESGDTIHDIVRFIKAPVRMIGTGWVASAGALIYVAVPLDRRFSLPNTRFLLHQPAGGARGTASDVEIEAREILKMRERLNRVFAERTGQSIERIEDDTRRNFWLDAKMAMDYGLVGRIVQNVNELG